MSITEHSFILNETRMLFQFLQWNVLINVTLHWVIYVWKGLY